jgi:hypothetical protein
MLVHSFMGNISVAEIRYTECKQFVIYSCPKSKTWIFGISSVCTGEFLLCKTIQRNLLMFGK